MVRDNRMLPVILVLENPLDRKLGEHHNFSWHGKEEEEAGVCSYPKNLQIDLSCDFRVDV
jgi:hypothetical protein